MNYKTLFLILLASSILSSCTLGRYVWYNAAEVDDYKHFEQRKILKSSQIYKFPKAKNQLNLDSLIQITKKRKDIKSIENQIEKSGTLALIMIKNDSIIYENYFNGFTNNSISGSFSMAKSIVSLLIGCAIEDGYINSEKDSITKYLPELSQNGFDNITIENLLQMNSGIKFWENYWFPFADAGNFYYGRDLWKLTQNMKKKYEPGEVYDYRSGDTQLLGFILTRALKDLSLSEYLEKRIWQPIGLEHDASWLIDSKGMERAFVGINATALDFAKIGLLILHDGAWNDKQIIPKEWIEKSFIINPTNYNPQQQGKDYIYQYQWYLKDGGEKGVYALGYRGQYIYFNKEAKTVMIRLGKRNSKKNGLDWDELFYLLSENYN